ncbi:hypothetical protein GGR51DRAFT_544111 [Nemania sp. FL0031]|nr:hypothetical protein GGR51DRAFT_544111 [Nemania sp. FL0031]
MPHCPNYSDDQSSMDSTNISVGGSSQQQTGSECPTRSTSPGPHDQSLVELQLRTKPQPPVTEGRNGSLLSPAVRRSLPNSDRLNKSTSVDVGSMEVPWHDMSVLKADEMTESNMVDQSHCSTSVKSMPINDPMVLYLNTIGGAFTEPFGSGEVENGLSSGTDDSSDEDLDLEQFANKFLSEKFGIGLGKIRRPHRIVDVFHQVEKKCVGILEDEGHGFIGSPCSEESQSEPVDGGDDMTYHPARGGPSHSTSGGPYTPTGTKRPSNDATDLEGASGPSHLTKSRRPKRRRTEGDFSCPYRKRNPRRFNIRDHEECANRSHRDISMLT